MLQSSNLVQRLAEVAEERQRPDGWTLLSTAGSVLRQEFAEALPKLRRGYGVRNLRDVLVASQVFDVENEPTPRGGKRVVYRVKSGA